ncbi:hypothetical protein HNY73_014514 [Argiope bruennichi]|uniref:Uncharacterized protein n=1 Tax=Argiope bruennichi TaxID=94029 RepID=A0A8T0ETG0_ARGBR|nr:hypothetical protein HNY73_014514 [Argiope bruennichi]
MGKAADLSNFDKGQMVTARPLRTSISETPRLVGCSRAVVSTYRKWCMDGETTSNRPPMSQTPVIQFCDGAPDLHGSQSPTPNL